MNRRIAWVLLICLLLSGCGPDAGGEDTAATTGSTAMPLRYPEPLENGFYVCCDRIDRVYNACTVTQSINFYVIAGEPFAEEDISAWTGDMEWQVGATLIDAPIDSTDSQPVLHRVFSCYQGMDWANIYFLSCKYGEDPATPWWVEISKYHEACDAAGEDLFPEFYCYKVTLLHPKAGYPDELDLEDGHRETDLTVKIKDEVQVLEDIGNIVFYKSDRPMRNPTGPLNCDGFGFGGRNVPTNAQGYFIVDNPLSYTAEKDLTITGVEFMDCTTTVFQKLRVTVAGASQEWDGKTPIQLYAGDSFTLTFLAADPALANLLMGDFNRTLQLNYVCEGEEYAEYFDMHHFVRLNPYECYAMANGIRDSILEYYIEYKDKGLASIIWQI